MRVGKLFLLNFALVTLLAQPPSAPKKPVTDTYHGVTVIDDYRWLEDRSDPNVKAWSDAENRVTRQYLDALPTRTAVYEQLKRLYARQSARYNCFSRPVGRLPPRFARPGGRLFAGRLRQYWRITSASLPKDNWTLVEASVCCSLPLPFPLPCPTRRTAQRSPAYIALIMAPCYRATRADPLCFHEMSHPTEIRIRGGREFS
jgi:hypothetical protein